MKRNLLDIASADSGKMKQYITNALNVFEDANVTIRKVGGSRGVVDELKADGQYNADFFYNEYEKITGKVSSLSRRKREFINDICWSVIIKLAEDNETRVG